MTAGNPILDELTAPLGPDWTVEELAERVLTSVATHTTDGEEFTLDLEAITDRQARRLFRPLLACLATRSGANLYGGTVAFERSGPNGGVSIHGEFENGPGAAHITLRRDVPGSRNGQPMTSATAPSA